MSKYKDKIQLLKNRSSSEKINKSVNAGMKMDKQTRKRSKLINTLNIPLYAASMIACEHKAVFYKELWGYTFYTIDNIITFRIDDIKPRFVIIGLVGVSDDDELIKSFIEVMNFLGYKVDIQEDFSILNSEHKSIKYKKN